jgi:lysosomal Pro-X carboxypeptidase
LNATSVEDAASKVGVCADSIPSHISTQEELSDSLVQLASFTLASENSAAYPPGPDTDLFKTCQVFQDTRLDFIGRFKAFMDRVLVEGIEGDKNCELNPELCDPIEELKSIREGNGGRECFDLGAEFPDAPPSNLVGGVLDSYDDGTMWEFQTCTTVIFLAGFSETSLFPARNASYEDLTKDCLDSFGVTPRPRELADMWGFDDLVNRGASRILFTNGVQDMWAGGSIMTNLSDSLLALNFENGAHHSDLNHRGPADSDTADIKAGYVAITDILGNWIDEIMAESRY